MPLIIVCRFIPGGRTAVMLSCGIIRYDRRRFVIATAIAGMIWASYSFFIGRLGGRAFEDKPWAGLLLALGGTLAVSGLIELVRRLRARQAQRRADAREHTEEQSRDDAFDVPAVDHVVDAGAVGQAHERNLGPGQAGLDDHAGRQLGANVFGGLEIPVFMPAGEQG